MRECLTLYNTVRIRDKFCVLDPLHALDSVEFDTINVTLHQACPFPATSMRTPATRPNERPLSFDLDENTYEIASIENCWHDPEAEYFKVCTTDGKLYLLSYVQRAIEWTLQSGFDGDELLTRAGH